jgi:hypothetical protein
MFQLADYLQTFNTEAVEFNQIQRNLQISKDLETISDSKRILQISKDLKTVRGSNIKQNQTRTAPTTHSSPHHHNTISPPPPTTTTSTQHQ